MSDLTQMFGLAVQNFLSAATGMAVLMAFTRGIGQHDWQLWVDLVRSVLYILLPLSGVLALLLISQGVVQSFSGPQTVQSW